MFLSKTTGQKIDGVIGEDILHRYTVKIDFENRILTLFDNKQFVRFPNGEDIPLEVNSLVSSIPLTLSFSRGKQVGREFVIDKGAPVNVIIHTPFAEKYGLHTALKRNEDKEFNTLADVQAGFAVHAESIRIGRFACNDMEIFISTSKNGLFSGSTYAGIVGNKFFQHFNVIFDYERKRLTLEKL
jgi:hypothetical protein